MYLAYSYTNNAERLQRWKISAFQLFTVFTYANSAINPVIYGFTNDFFKKSFRNIFGCQHPSGRRSGTVPNENGTVATRLRSTQCRPSRRRMTTLSGRPDLCDRTKSWDHSLPRLLFLSSSGFNIQCCCPRGKSLSSRIVEDQFSSPCPCPRKFKSSKIFEDLVGYLCQHFVLG